MNRFCNESFAPSVLGDARYEFVAHLKARSPVCMAMRF
jgi:hypothetical protein